MLLRLWVNTRPPLTATLQSALETGTSQTGLVTEPLHCALRRSAETPSWFGPRNCVHSAAKPQSESDTTTIEQQRNAGSRRGMKISAIMGTCRQCTRTVRIQAGP